MALLLLIGVVLAAWTLAVYLANRAAKHADPYASFPRGNGHLPATTNYERESR